MATLFIWNFAHSFSCKDTLAHSIHHGKSWLLIIRKFVWGHVLPSHMLHTQPYTMWQNAGLGPCFHIRGLWKSIFLSFIFSKQTLYSLEAANGDWRALHITCGIKKELSSQLISLYFGPSHCSNRWSCSVRIIKRGQFYLILPPYCSCVPHDVLFQESFAATTFRGVWELMKEDREDRLLRTPSLSGNLRPTNNVWFHLICNLWFVLYKQRIPDNNWTVVWSCTDNVSSRLKHFRFGGLSPQKHLHS